MLGGMCEEKSLSVVVKTFENMAFESQKMVNWALVACGWSQALWALDNSAAGGSQLLKSRIEATPVRNKPMQVPNGSLQS